MYIFRDENFFVDARRDTEKQRADNHGEVQAQMEY